MCDYENCIATLKNIDNKVSSLEISNNTKFEEAYEACVTNDQKKLESVKSKCNELQTKVSTLAKSIEKKRVKLASVLDDLRINIDNCEKLKKKAQSGPIQPKTKTETQTLKSVLKTVQDVTAVRFIYGAPEEVVSGYVGIPKGDLDKDPILEPFIIPRDSDDIVEQIWNKIEEAVKADDTEIIEKIQQMDISRIIEDSDDIVGV